MIIQHILTERIFRKIFDVADFMQRNVIAQEIEKVITALNSRSFSRDDFSKSLEHFYVAIENAAATITDFHEKQTFLNTVYERFFQGFCVKVADTHGIVYTPQPLVNFMVASVEHVLTTEFGKTLRTRTSTSSTLSPAQAISSSTSCGTFPNPRCRTNTPANCVATKSCCCRITSPR